MSDSYENPQFSETCDLYREIERLKEELSTHRAHISSLTQALERVYNNGKGSEVFPASHVAGEKATDEFIVVEQALQSSRTSHLGERERAKDAVIEAARKVIKLADDGDIVIKQDGHYIQLTFDSLTLALHRLDGCREGK